MSKHLHLVLLVERWQSQILLFYPLLGKDKLIVENLELRQRHDLAHNDSIFSDKSKHQHTLDLDKLLCYSQLKLQEYHLDHYPLILLSRSN